MDRIMSPCLGAGHSPRFDVAHADVLRARGVRGAAHQLLLLRATISRELRKFAIVRVILAVHRLEVLRDQIVEGSGSADAYAV